MARDGHARTTGHDQHRPGIVGCVVTRSVSATAKTGYSVRINFENMLRLAQAVSSCATCPTATGTTCATSGCARLV